MPHTSSDLEYHTSTMQGHPEVTIVTQTGLRIWLTEKDLTELLTALRRRKVKR